jgi:hypothetical protein
MSTAGEAKAKEHALVSGAKPRLEERVRERGWRPTRECYAFAQSRTEAARRRAIARARHRSAGLSKYRNEGAD